MESRQPNPSRLVVRPTRKLRDLRIGPEQPLGELECKVDRSTYRCYVPLDGAVA